MGCHLVFTSKLVQVIDITRLKSCLVAALLTCQLVQLMSRLHWGAQPDSMPAWNIHLELLLNVLTLAAANAVLAELLLKLC